MCTYLEKNNTTNPIYSSHYIFKSLRPLLHDIDHQGVLKEVMFGVCDLFNIGNLEDATCLDRDVDHDVQIVNNIAEYVKWYLKTSKKGDGELVYTHRHSE